jgi:hypothetical protein
MVLNVEIKTQNPFPVNSKLIACLARERRQAARCCAWQIHLPRVRKLYGPDLAGAKRPFPKSS